MNVGTAYAVFITFHQAASVNKQRLKGLVFLYQKSYRYWVTPVVVISKPGRGMALETTNSTCMQTLEN